MITSPSTRGAITLLLIKSIAMTSGVFVVVAAAVLYARPTYQGRRAGFADENYLKSGECRSCHADHYASWARTFHSRMTQDAKPASVQGDFEHNNSYEYLGVKARMEKRGDAFFMTFNFRDGRTQTSRVDRTVGSRRIEQYLSKQSGQYTRLPLAYDLVNRRWMSLNGSFFYPDSDNYFQHTAQWDANCVFCHNVKAQPHIDFKTKQFDTEVTELGIACGACHGPVKPDPLWASPFLAEAFGDKYPIVRFFVANGLSRPGVPWVTRKPDYLGSVAERELMLQQWRETMTICRADAREQAETMSARLSGRRQDVDVEVGE